MFDLKINYKSTSCRLKVGQLLLESGAALMYYKAGQVVLQSRLATTEWGNFYHKVGQVLQSGTNFITHLDRYYKVGRLLKVG